MTDARHVLRLVAALGLTACVDSAEQGASPLRVAISHEVVLRVQADTVDLAPMVPVSSGRGFLAAQERRPPAGGVAVFSSQGEFVRSIGRHGRGPGELGMVTSIGFDPGDTLWIVDSHFRAHLFTPPPALAFVRTVTFDRPLAGKATPLGFLSEAFVVSEQTRPPILTSWEGRTIASYGRATARSAAYARLAPVTPVDSATIWSASGNSYAIDLLSSDGETRRRIGRNVKWFPPDLPAPRGFPWQVRPNPRIADLSLDDDGHLWVLVRRPHRKWRPRGGSSSAAPLAPGRIPEVSTTDLFEGVVDVFDSASGRLIASLEVSGGARGFLPPSTLAEFEEGPDGRTSIRLRSLVLARR